MREWYADYLDACNRHDLDAIASFVDPLVRRAHLPGGVDAWIADADELFRAFPDWRWRRIQLVVEDDRIVGYRLRQPDQKREAVRALQGLNYKVIAAGDSYTDTTMLGAADAGFLFRAPDNVIAEFPQFPAHTDYEALLGAIAAELGT